MARQNQPNDAESRVADALSQQRDEDRRQQESQRREILGPEGKAFLDSIADGMRNGSARNLVGAIQRNLGGARGVPDPGPGSEAGRKRL
jgi:hypothetical protein